MTAGGWRVLALVILVPLFGIRPLLLLPIWLLGLVVYRLLRNGVSIGRTRAWLLTLTPPAIYVAALAVGLPKFLLGLRVMAIGQRYVSGLLNFSNEFIWNNLLGFLAAAHFLGAATLLRLHPVPERPRLDVAIRCC